MSQADDCHVAEQDSVHKERIDYRRGRNHGISENERAGRYCDGLCGVLHPHFDYGMGSTMSMLLNFIVLSKWAAKIIIIEGYWHILMLKGNYSEILRIFVVRNNIP